MPDISLPIVELLTHPPIGFLRREVIPGLFSGSGDLTRPSPFPLGPQVDAIGLSWSFFTVPDTIGFTLGEPVIFEDRMLQLSVHHRSRDGNQFASEYHDFSVEGIYLLFANAFPTRVHYEIRTAVDVVFYWLLV